MKYEYEILYRIKGVPEHPWDAYGGKHYNEVMAKIHFDLYQRTIPTREFKLMRRQVGEWEEVKK